MHDRLDLPQREHYELTRSGRKRFAHESAAWDRLTAAVALVLRMS